jgi:hypothetical protein
MLDKILIVIAQPIQNPDNTFSVHYTTQNRITNKVKTNTAIYRHYDDAINKINLLNKSK